MVLPAQHATPTLVNLMYLANLMDLAMLMNLQKEHVQWP
jgi:hypothetical protein